MGRRVLSLALYLLKRQMETLQRVYVGTADGCMALSVCMNTYISETLKATNIKFGDNMSY